MACPQRQSVTPPDSGTEEDAATMVALQHPSNGGVTADALVVSPGLGIGAVSLGMERSAIEHLGLTPTRSYLGGRFVEYGALDVSYTDAAPGGVVSSVRVYVNRAMGGIRVSGATLPANTPYATLKEAIGACGPAEHGESGEVTSCLGGSVEIVQSSLTNDLRVGVRRQ